MIYNLQIRLDEPQDNYLSASARIRKVSRSVLLGAVVKAILDDQLILSVLDDNSAPMPLSKRTRVPSEAT